ncbi:MAG: TrkA family potassium uptake protein [Eubacteriaceae bacterium]|nr:TrkA family potassium uptake protein [Eubacteriaceae bacterium]
MKKQFAVIGLGRFGISLAKELYKAGNDVYAIDTNEELVKKIAADVTYAVQADGTDINALKSLGIRNIDVLIIALASNISASLLTALNAIELGIPKIYAKAYSEPHAKILYKIGVAKVYFPEIDMGQRVARELCNSNLLDLIELDNNYSIAEIIAPQAWAGKTIAQLNVRKKYGITILLIKSKDGIDISPSPEDVISEQSKLLVLGEEEQIQKFCI